MTTTDYLINAVCVFLVLRQARERTVDLRSFLVPLVIVFFVAQNYVHSIPSAGNDLLLVGALVGVGLILGVAGGFATQVRRAADGNVLARVGWIAGGLLIAGVLARMVFVFFVNNGGAATVYRFSFDNHLTKAAWPLALVAMALVEIVVRQSMVQIRARQLRSAAAPVALAVPAQA